jgi:hypothetical protein
VADVVPGVLPKVATAAANLASAALQAGPSGALFRVAFMPAYLASDYAEVWSETKITAVTNPTTNLTTAALSLSYNPFAMKGGRADHLWREAVRSAQCGARYAPIGSTIAQKPYGWLWTTNDDPTFVTYLDDY